MKNYWKYLGLIVSVTGLSIYLIRKSKAQPIPTDYNKEAIGKLIVTTPNAGNSFNILIVYGGTDYATPSWMLSQIPNSILLNNLIFFAPYTKSINETFSEYTEYIRNRGFEQKSLSLIGFSAGGVDVMSKYDQNYRFFGLIDPSVSSGDENKNYGSNTHLIYNNSNWGYYPSIKALQPKLATKIANGGGSVESVRLSHSEIPKYFWDKFQSMLT